MLQITFRINVDASKDNLFVCRTNLHNVQIINFYEKCTFAQNHHVQAKSHFGQLNPTLHLKAQLANITQFISERIILHLSLF